MPRDTAGKTATAERRKQVAALYLRGHTQANIAVALGVGQATISRDVKAILEEWQRERLDNAESYVSKQQREIEMLRAQLWRAYEGNTLAVDTLADKVVKLQEREARLLGLDAPKRTDVTSGNERIEIVLFGDGDSGDDDDAR